jgi:hypothetical protein
MKPIVWYESHHYDELTAANGHLNYFPQRLRRQVLRSQNFFDRSLSKTPDWE